MIKWGTISMVLVVVLVSSCSSTKNGENSDREDLTAKELLQGVWLDDETDMPLMLLAVIRSIMLTHKMHLFTSRYFVIRFIYAEIPLQLIK
mgnify:CR=1 FL=1